jgi:hypothetical protein
MPVQRPSLAGAGAGPGAQLSVDPRPEAAQEALS